MMWTELGNFYLWVIASPQQLALGQLLVFGAGSIIFGSLLARVFDGHDSAARFATIILLLAALVGVTLPAVSNASGLGGIMIILGVVVLQATALMEEVYLEFAARR